MAVQKGKTRILELKVREYASFIANELSEPKCFLSSGDITNMQHVLLFHENTEQHISHVCVADIFESLNLANFF